MYLIQLQKIIYQDDHTKNLNLMDLNFLIINTPSVNVNYSKIGSGVCVFNNVYWNERIYRITNNYTFIFINRPKIS